MVDNLKKPISEYLNLTDNQTNNMSFYDVNTYSDTIFARNFEGLPHGNFTETQMHDVFEVNKWAQLSKFSEEARKAWMT